MSDIEKVVIPEDGGFELPEKYQKMSRVQLIMPFSNIIFYRKSQQMFFRNPEKDEPYCENGYLLINGKLFMTVDNEGNQRFWETPEIDKYGNPKDSRKDTRVPKGQKTLGGLKDGRSEEN